MNNIIWVPEFKVDSLIKSANTLLKRAKLIEAKAPSIIVTDETKVVSAKNSRTNGVLAHTLRQIRFVKVILEGESPVLDDWTPIAKLQHNKYEDGYRNVITPLTNVPESREYIDLDSSNYNPDCAHCEHKRYRKTTFLLMNKFTNEVVQVGSTCLNDFTRHSSLKELLNYFRVIDTFLSYSDCNYSFSDPTLTSTNIPLETFSRVVTTIVSEFGYRSRRAAEFMGQHPTADITYKLFCEDESLNELNIAQLVEDEINNESIDISDILNYFKNTLPNEPTNDFAFKLLPVLKRDAVNIDSASEIGLVCGAIGGFLNRKKAEEEKAKAEADKVTTLNEFIGVVGANIEAELTVTDKRVVVNTFNGVEQESTLIYFLDNDSRVIKAFSAGKIVNKLEVGSKYKIAATVKAHEIFKNEHQTLLTRIKFPKSK